MKKIKEHSEEIKKISSKYQRKFLLSHLLLLGVGRPLELFNHTIKYCVFKSMSKMWKIDQIHLRAVMLCMSKTGKKHTHTFLNITFLIFNQFSIWKKFWKAET